MCMRGNMFFPLAWKNYHSRMIIVSILVLLVFRLTFILIRLQMFGSQI